MEVLVDRCAGLDVHKRTVVACVRTPGEGRQKRRSEVRTFGTFESQLVELREWLIEVGVTQVAMEATGVFWKPVVRHEAPCDRGEVKGLPLWAVAAAC